MVRAAILSIALRAGIIDPDHDYLLQLFITAESVCRTVQFRTSPTECDVRAGEAEHVLAIMQVQHRITPFGGVVIGSRQINPRRSWRSQELRWNRNGEESRFRGLFLGD